MMRLFLSFFFAVAVAGGPATAGLITVNSGDCVAIAAHVPDEDVAYQPGVDAYGNAVAPADLNASGRIDYNVDDIVISIGNPLVATPGVVGDQTAFVAAGGRIDSFGAETSVGSITLRDDEVYFNGKRITDNQARAMAIACAEKQ